VYGNRLRASLHNDPPEWAEDQSSGTMKLAGVSSSLGAHRVYAPALGSALHAGCQVHIVTHHGVVEPGAATHVSYHADPGVEPDARLEGMDQTGPSLALPFPLLAQFAQASLDPLGRDAGAQGVVCSLNGGSIHGHDGIADVFVQRPSLGLNNVGTSTQVFIEEIRQLRRAQHFRKGGEVLNIAEVRRDLRVVATEFGLLARFDQAGDNRGREIGAEHPADSSLLFFLKDHLPDEGNEARAESRAYRSDQGKQEMAEAEGLEGAPHVASQKCHRYTLEEESAASSTNGEYTNEKGQAQGNGKLKDRCLTPRRQGCQEFAADDGFYQIPVNTHLGDRFYVKGAVPEVLHEF